jgi:hypothetical protein
MITGRLAFPFFLPSKRFAVVTIHRLTRIASVLALSSVAAVFQSQRAAAVEPGSPSETIERSAALKVGEWTVSNYLLDKYYSRFVGEFRQKFQREPERAEISRWFRQFVVRQTIIARAVSLGYLQRPEVQEEVARMERHMLTQPYGPFYKQIFSGESMSEEKLQSIYRDTVAPHELIVVRFRDERQESQYVGEGFFAQSTEEQTGRILRCRNQDELEFSAGTSSWPFFPFVEIADEICRMKSGSWVVYRDPSLGIYYVLLQERRSDAPNNASNVPADFRGFVEHIQSTAFARKRRLQLLARACIEFDRENGRRVLDFWSNHFSSDAKLDELPTRPMAEAVLFTYRLDGRTVPVSAGTFRQRFNELYLRKYPRTLAELRLRGEDLVVEEMDFAEARVAGIDRSTQFVEDRRGFAGFQALELFEKEEVRRRLAPSQTIDALELQLASEFADRTQVQDHLNYAKYNLAGDELNLPWSK